MPGAAASAALAIICSSVGLFDSSGGGDKRRSTSGGAGPPPTPGVAADGLRENAARSFGHKLPSPEKVFGPLAASVAMFALRCFEEVFTAVETAEAANNCSTVIGRRASGGFGVGCDLSIGGRRVSPPPGTIGKALSRDAAAGADRGVVIRPESDGRVPPGAFKCEPGPAAAAEGMAAFVSNGGATGGWRVCCSEIGSQTGCGARGSARSDRPTKGAIAKAAINRPLPTRMASAVRWPNQRRTADSNDADCAARSGGRMPQSGSRARIGSDRDVDGASGKSAKISFGCLAEAAVMGSALIDPPAIAMDSSLGSKRGRRFFRLNACGTSQTVRTRLARVLAKAIAFACRSNQTQQDAVSP